MRILFLTLAKIDSVYQRGNYSDLIREISSRGDEIITVSPSERRYALPFRIIKEELSTIIKVWTPNIQKSNKIEKSIGLFLIQFLYFKAAHKHIVKQHVDLILYSTPPITLNWIISYYKKKFNAKTYLLLKDIFPQNAVDLGFLRYNSHIYKYFRNIEKNLYKISDHIGTMSQANSNYIIKQNPDVSRTKVEVNPNSINISINPTDQLNFNEYNIPFNEKCIFIYGGNIGKPQNIDFLIQAIGSCQYITKAFFVVVGSGTEWGKISNWFNKTAPKNAILIPELIQNDYEALVKLCDVGLILLHPHFTIPNYPSRLLYYMLYSLPVLCATDMNTDIGLDAEKNKFGFWCKNGDEKEFIKYIEAYTTDKKLINNYGKNAFRYLKKNFNVNNTYDIIFKHLYGDNDI